MIIRNKRWNMVVAIACLMAPLPSMAGEPLPWRGDANKDGQLTVEDIINMVDLLNEGKPVEALMANPALDTDKDGVFSIKDVQTLAQVLVGKEAPQRLNTSTTISDKDQSNPTMGDNSGLTDEEQHSPSTGNTGGGGGLKDSDMGNPE